ncbi:xanthine dehydrogenase family protein subunit M [Comamonas sp. NLF-1-9]|uniref:FAD binding domain-containing protein n=1 Tax=Comamonas sp. NLF-1-9 TaxID=2853163 RepID=UPI001C438D30|nr:FAD binding domain-containing protein [Comamonas sp. NLF-1-9]QXL84162.1 FAD binding domain-containing protein [Comamonas sp. NLF-1-9]
MPHIAINEAAPFQLHSPGTLDEALQLAQQYQGNCSYLAGGCDLMDMKKRQWNNTAHVIDLKRIDALKGVRRSGERLVVGALAKLSELQNGDFGPELHALKQAAARVATPQIRNMGTAGGNLLQDNRCPYFRGPFYCYRHGGNVCYAHHGVNREHALFDGDRCYTVSPSDLAPVVVALDAIIHVRDFKRAYTIPAARLFVAPSEDITIMHRVQNGAILTGIEIPLRGGNRRSAFIKDTIRNSWDFARGSIAVSMDWDGRTMHQVRVVIGAVAAVPWRSYAAERVLEGAEPSAQTLQAAAEAATRGAETLQYNAYKIGMTQALVHDVLSTITSSEPEPPKSAARMGGQLPRFLFS